MEQAITEAAPALAALRDEGVISAIGFGMNYVAPLKEAVERCDLDVILVAGRYTLLDQAALDSGLLAACAERGSGRHRRWRVQQRCPRRADRWFDLRLRAGGRRAAGPGEGDRRHLRAAWHVVARRGAALRRISAADHDAADRARDIDEVRADVAMLDDPVDPALWAALRDEGLLLLP